MVGDLSQRGRKKRVCITEKKREINQEWNYEQKKKSINDAEREKNKSISANKNIHAYVIAQNCKI